MKRKPKRKTDLLAKMRQQEALNRKVKDAKSRFVLLHPQAWEEGLKLSEKEIREWLTRAMGQLKEGEDGAREDVFLYTFLLMEKVRIWFKDDQIRRATLLVSRMD